MLQTSYIKQDTANTTCRKLLPKINVSALIDKYNLYALSKCNSIWQCNMQKLTRLHWWRCTS